ncbi:SWIB/MDM2 domain-containing protein [Phthorimaea operculella]|nr:SWIB/MDM2 domain-containing protein [Phthorimaea operculella]
MSEEISEAELKTEIESILKDADLSKTYTKHVIQKLEKKLGIELQHMKKTIDKMVMDYVNSQESSDSDEEKASEKSEEEKASEDEEEEEERPKKRKKETKPKAKTTKVWKKAERSDVSDLSDEDEKPKKRGKKKGSDDEWEKPKKKAGGGRGKGSGYTRAYKLSPALADLMGKESMPRHEVVKRVWEIIKSKNLYDQNNKQFAICDDALYKVIGTKRFRIFGMMKYLKTHFIDE